VALITRNFRTRNSHDVRNFILSLERGCDVFVSLKLGFEARRLCSQAIWHRHKQKITAPFQANVAHVILPCQFYTQNWLLYSLVRIAAAKMYVVANRASVFGADTLFNLKPCVNIYLRFTISSASKSDPHNIQNKWNCVGCLHILWNTCRMFWRVSYLKMLFQL